MKNWEPACLDFVADWCVKINRQVTNRESLKAFDDMISILTEKQAIFAGTEWVSTSTASTMKHYRVMIFPLGDGFTGCTKHGCSLLIGGDSIKRGLDVPEYTEKVHSHFEEIDDNSIHFTSDEYQYNWFYQYECIHRAVDQLYFG